MRPWFGVTSVIIISPSRFGVFALAFGVGVSCSRAAIIHLWGGVACLSVLVCGRFPLSLPRLGYYREGDSCWQHANVFSFCIKRTRLRLAVWVVITKYLSLLPSYTFHNISTSTWLSLSRSSAERYISRLGLLRHCKHSGDMFSGYGGLSHGIKVFRAAWIVFIFPACSLILLLDMFFSCTSRAALDQLSAGFQGSGTV